MNRLKKSAMGRKLAALLTLSIFLLGLMAQPALALDFGVYTAPANTYYKNPETGVIEDGGTQNEELGEGMCRSAVGETALIEVDADGNVYVTMRMLLYSNLSKIKFYVQNTPGGSYSQVKASITAEDSGNDSADFRLKMPRAGANVKTVMYVAPMGRDVTFFWNVSAGSAKAGSGDFAVNINLNAKPKAEEPKQEEVTPAVSEPAKTEVKTETQTEVKAETKTEVKSEAKNEVKAETDSATKQEAKTEPAAETTSKTEQDDRQEVTADDKTEAQSETVTEEQPEITEEPAAVTEKADAEEEASASEKADETAAEAEGGIGFGPIAAIAAVAVIAVVLAVMKKK